MQTFVLNTPHAEASGCILIHGIEYVTCGNICVRLDSWRWSVFVARRIVFSSCGVGLLRVGWLFYVSLGFLWIMCFGAPSDCRCGVDVLSAFGLFEYLVATESSPQGY